MPLKILYNKYMCCKGLKTQTPTPKADLTVQCEASPAEPWIDAAGVMLQRKAHFLPHETIPAERADSQWLKKIIFHCYIPLYNTKTARKE